MTTDNEPRVADLIMIIARLVRDVRKLDPENGTALSAMDYLKRKNCTPSILRDMMPTVTMADAANVLDWVEGDDDDEPPAYDYDRGDGFFREHSE